MSNQQPSVKTPKESRVFAGAFALFSLALLGFFVYLVAAGKEGQFITLIAALVALIGSRASDIVSFNLSAQGLSAELERKIMQAQTTLSELQGLASTWGMITTELIYGSGRWGGMERKAKKDLVEEIRETLEAIGVEADEVINEVTYKYDHFDYAHSVFKAGPSYYDPAWNEALEANTQAHSGIGNEASPDEIEKLFKTHQRLTPEVQEALSDYRHFEQTRKHRRSNR